MKIFLNNEKIQMNGRISGITLYVLTYVLVAGSMYEALKMVFMCTNERRKVCKGNRIEKGAAVFGRRDTKVARFSRIDLEKSLANTK